MNQNIFKPFFYHSLEIALILIAAIIAMGTRDPTGAAIVLLYLALTVRSAAITKEAKQ